MLLFVFVGLLLLRFTERVLFELLFHPPPRITFGPLPLLCGSVEDRIRQKLFRQPL